MNDCRFLTIYQSSASLAYHKPLTIHELKNSSGGRRGDRRICAAKMASAMVTLCPKQRDERCWLNFRCLANAMSLTS